MIFRALKSIRIIVGNDDGSQSPIKCRHAGYKKEDQVSNPKPEFKVIEYLLDFSLSRFSIPDAIDDTRANSILDGKFELLFSTAESELGNDLEVCRDLLKLLDTRSKIRCLLYKKRPNPQKVDNLNRRILNVLNHHAHFEDTRDGWLFVALEKADGHVTASAFTLADNELRIVPVVPPPVAPAPQTLAAGSV